MFFFTLKHLPKPYISRILILTLSCFLTSQLKAHTYTQLHISVEMVEPVHVNCRLLYTQNINERNIGKGKKSRVNYVLAFEFNRKDILFITSSLCFVLWLQFTVAEKSRRVVFFSSSSTLKFSFWLKHFHSGLCCSFLCVFMPTRIGYNKNPQLAMHPNGFGHCILFAMV